MNYGFWDMSEPAASDFNSALTVTTDYIGNKIYVNNQLKYILTEEGYIEKSGSAYNVFYYLNDRLGNHRIVMDATGAVKQVNNFYPSGTSMAERRTDQGIQPYKFEGKELDRFNGLDFYDFEARAYDPVLMRFTRTDPLAEKKPWLSPYCAFGNNPVRNIDPDGRYWVNSKDSTYAAQMQKEMDTKAKSEQNSLDNLNAKIAKNQAKGKDVSQDQAKAAGMKANIDNLKAGITELTDMGETTDQGFTFKAIDGIVGGTDKNKDGIIVMEIAGNGDIANGVHEASHGYDIWMNGATTIGMKGNMIQREVKAYSRQFSYEKKSLPATYDQSEFGKANSLIDINNRWVLGIKSGGEYIYIKKMYPNENPNDLIKRIK